MQFAAAVLPLSPAQLASPIRELHNHLRRCVTMVCAPGRIHFAASHTRESVLRAQHRHPEGPPRSRSPLRAVERNIKPRTESRPSDGVPTTPCPTQARLHLISWFVSNYRTKRTSPHLNPRQMS